MLVKITLQSPMDGSAPNSPIIQDVNWSDLEDIVSLEKEHVASSPTHSTYPESTLLPIRKKRTRQPPSELQLKQSQERRKARRNERRKELLLEKKAKDAKAHQEFLKINREKARKKRSEMTKEQRIQFNERNRILQKSYRANRKEKTGFTTKFYQEISEIKEQIKIIKPLMNNSQL